MRSLLVINELLDKFAMLRGQHFCDSPALVFHKLASFLKENRLDLLDLSIKVDLNLMNLLIELFHYLFVHLK